MALFTPEELEELRRADAELDENFTQAQEERVASRKRDREILLDNMDRKQRKIAESQRAYYEANRDKIAESQRAYREANREKCNAYMREYMRRRRAAAAGRALQ